MDKSKGRPLEDREILSALFRSRVEVVEASQADLRWCQFSVGRYILPQSIPPVYWWY